MSHLSLLLQHRLPIAMRILLSTLLLLCLSSPFAAAQGFSNLGSTCVGGIPAGGIPGNWPLRTFDLTLTQTGSFISVNGSSPGPRLILNQFDWVTVTVNSQLANDSITAIHWHGLTLFGTPYNDGVAGVTQCGQESNTTVTYSFCAYPSGDYWYHSVSQLQTVRGLYGAITIRPLFLNLTAINITLINTNTTAQQSIADDFVWMAADQYDANATFSDYSALPLPQGVLVDGVASNMTHIYTAGINATFVRLFNAGSTSSFTFSVDGANMNITALDGASVTPFPVSSVTLSAGQRATAVLDFTSIANYSSVYYRVARNAGSNPDWVGVLHIGVNDTDQSYPNYVVANCTTSYTNGTDANCTVVLDSSIPAAPINRTFTDMNALEARPLNYETIGAAYYGEGLVDIPNAGYSLSLAILLRSNGRLGQTAAVVPYINNATFNSSAINDPYTSDYTTPFLYNDLITLYNSGNTSNLTSTPSPVLLSSNSIEYVIPVNGVTNIMVLNSDPIQHSFHMHGHHFWVVSSSDAPEAEYAYANGYIVRDTVAIPANGWVKIRMIGNNPGVWLFSSANEVYLTQGFAVLLIENVDALTPNFFVVPTDQYQLCNATIQGALIAGVAAWHSTNDPVTYADTGLSQASRIVIGTVVGGISGAILLIIVLCTLVGIKRDPVAVKRAGDSGPIVTTRSSPMTTYPSANSQMPLNPAEQTVTTPESSQRRGVEMA